MTKELRDNIIALRDKMVEEVEQINKIISKENIDIDDAINVCWYSKWSWDNKQYTTLENNIRKLQ